MTSTIGLGRGDVELAGVFATVAFSEVSFVSECIFWKPVDFVNTPEHWRAVSPAAEGKFSVFILYGNSRGPFFVKDVSGLCQIFVDDVESVSDI